MRNLVHLLLILVVASGVYADEQSQESKPSMYSLFVTIHIQPQHSETVFQATMDIAEASVTEPGCFRYDVLRDSENPATIYIFEVFRDHESHAIHTETTHFARWYETAAHLLDRDMKIVKMKTAFPSVGGYESQKSGLINW
jgi:quinol monooxygenase YgiN